MPRRRSPGGRRSRPAGRRSRPGISPRPGRDRRRDGSRARSAACPHRRRRIAASAPAYRTAFAVAANVIGVVTPRHPARGRRRRPRRGAPPSRSRTRPRGGRRSHRRARLRRPGRAVRSSASRSGARPRPPRRRRPRSADGRTAGTSVRTGVAAVDGEGASRAVGGLAAHATGMSMAQPSGHPVAHPREALARGDVRGSQPSTSRARRASQRRTAISLCGMDVLDVDDRAGSGSIAAARSLTETSSPVPAFRTWPTTASDSSASTTNRAQSVTYSRSRVWVPSP